METKTYITHRVKIVKKVREAIETLLNKVFELKEAKNFVDIVCIDPIKSVKLLECLLFKDNITLLEMLVDAGILSPPKTNYSVHLTAREMEQIKDAFGPG